MRARLPRMVNSTRRSLIALIASSALVLTACGGAKNADPARSQKDVSFKSCSQAKCTGTLDGANYEIEMPAKWNGALLLYSHGYRAPGKVYPDYTAADTSAQDAATPDTAKALLAQGYALAGSAYKSNGWAVADGVAAGEQLHDYFLKAIGKPTKTYVWGDSLGGLITETLAEKENWITAAAPMCGVLGGSNLNLDLALDVAYAVKTLLDPSLKITGFTSLDDANATLKQAVADLLAATKDIANGIPKILLIAGLAGAPAKTETYDAHDTASQIGAYVESIATAMGYGTYGRWDIEQRVGGNPSDNSAADYSTRVPASTRALMETVSPGSTDKLLALLAAGARVKADPSARTKFSALGDPTGDLQVPTITMHTEDDPLVLVQNERVFRQRVDANASKRKADLIQLYTAPPTTYTTAPYGAGHCNFTTNERVGMITLLNNWVTNGTYPGVGTYASAFQNDPGLDPAYLPATWPAATS
jgi:hypothetical protein